MDRIVQAAGQQSRYAAGMPLPCPELSPATRAALPLMQQALTILDQAGAIKAACHLQWAIDVLTDAPIERADELATLDPFNRV